MIKTGFLKITHLNKYLKDTKAWIQLFGNLTSTVVLRLLNIWHYLRSSEQVCMAEEEWKSGKAIGDETRKLMSWLCKSVQIIVNLWIWPKVKWVKCGIIWHETIDMIILMLWRNHSRSCVEIKVWDKSEAGSQPIKHLQTEIQLFRKQGGRTDQTIAVKAVRNDYIVDIFTTWDYVLSWHFEREGEMHRQSFQGFCTVQSRKINWCREGCGRKSFGNKNANSFFDMFGLMFILNIQMGILSPENWRKICIEIDNWCMKHIDAI